jgi:hypothetical protein
MLRRKLKKVAKEANGVAAGETTVEKKRGRKRKNATSEVPEPRAKVVRIGETPAAEGKLKTAALEKWRGGEK